MNDGSSRTTSWRSLLLVLCGIILALALALLLTQLDGMQKKSLLPTQRLQVIDLEGTISASDVTIVNISNDVGLELDTPSGPNSAGIPDNPGAATALPVFLPTCAAAPSGWSLYTVAAEDTLAILALRYKSTIAELRQANCLSEAEDLQSGQRIFVDMGPLAPTATLAGTCTPPAGWLEHTVAPGESLASMALDRNTTVSLILRLNCLEEQFLLPGTVLYLPSAIPVQPTSTASRAVANPTSTAPPPPGPNPPAPTVLIASPTTAGQLATATRLATALPGPNSQATRLPSATPTLRAIPSATPTTGVVRPPAAATATSAVGQLVTPTATFTATAISTLTATSTLTPSPQPSPTSVPTETPTLPSSTAVSPSTATPVAGYPGKQETPTATSTPTPTATTTPTPTSTSTPTLAPYPA